MWKEVYKSLRYRLLALASLIYILSVAVGGLALPIECARIGATAWLIASCAYALLSLYLSMRKMAFEGLLIFLISLFSIGMALQQRNMAQLLDALGAIRQPVKQCKLLLFLYERPKELQLDDFFVGDGRVLCRVNALVMEVLEPKGELERIEGYSVLLTIVGESGDGSGAPIEPDKVLVANGILNTLPHVSNPHQPRRIRKALMNGIVAHLRAKVDEVKTAQNDERMPLAGSYRLKARLQLFRMRFRERLFKRMRSWLPEKFRDETMAIISSMILGMHVAGLSEEIADVARRCGAVHLLVISGFHVSFIGMLALSLMRPLGGISVALCLALIGCYWLVSQGEPSISRAALMFAYALIGSVLKWHPKASHGARDWVTALCISAMLIVAIAPASILNIGFQLSFAATFGILWISTPMIDALISICDGHASRERNALRLVAWYPIAIVGAQLMTMPLLVYHFGKLIVIGFVSNLFLVPLALITVAFSFIGALHAVAYEAIASIHFATMKFVWEVLMGIIALLGKAIMWMAYVFSGWLVWLMGSFARIPFATVDVSEPIMGSFGMLVAAYVALICIPLTWHWLRWRTAHFNIRWLFRCALILSLITLMPFLIHSLLRFKPVATFTTLDVGQGQCIFVHAPNGKCMLIDAGTTGKDDGVGELLARERILPFLYHKRVRQIDVLVITHPDSDHVCALPTIAERIPIGVVLDPKLPSEEPSYLRALSILAERGTRMVLARKGIRITLDGKNGVYADVLAPSEPLLRGTKDDVNNNVVVLRLNMLGKSVLLTSDMMEDQERHLVTTTHPGMLNADVLYVPHHGGKYSCGDELLSVVRPQIALISCGRFNPFGHPHPEVIERLQKHGVQMILRTDEDGAIILKAIGGKLIITRFGKRW